MTTGFVRLLCCTVTVSQLRAKTATVLPECNNDPGSTQESCYIWIINGLKIYVLQLTGRQEPLLQQCRIKLVAVAAIFIWCYRVMCVFSPVVYVYSGFLKHAFFILNAGYKNGNPSPFTQRLFLKVHQLKTANVNNDEIISQKLLLIKLDHQSRAPIRPLRRDAKRFHSST